MRYASLDGIRGMAMLMVMCGHLVGSLGLLGVSAIYNKIFQTPLHLFFNETDAVIIFFALSGFVLHLPVSSADRDVKWVPFWIQRIFRLYPIYFINLFFCMVMYYAFFNAAEVTAFNPQLSIYATNPTWKELLHELIPFRPGLYQSPVNGPLWTLFVEFKISLIFPLISILAKRLKAVEFAVLIALVWVACAIQQSDTGKYLPMFLIGAFAAQHREWLRRFVPSRGFAQIILMLLLLSLFEVRYMPHAPGSYASSSITAISSVYLMLVAINAPSVSKIFSSRPLVMCGKMTLPLYLFHLPFYFSFLSNAYLLVHGHYMKFAIAASAMFLTTFVLAVLLHKFAEMPLNGLGHRLSKAHFLDFNVSGLLRYLPSSNRK